MISVSGSAGNERDDRSRSAPGSTSGAKYDDPPNSRLFIVCGRQITEEQFKEAFSAFGKIEEIWLVKDKISKNPKGITYIKFSKTSEAATAMEQMNGKCIGECPRPLKVLIAHARDQGSKREMNEDERLVRLFVVVPKQYKESDIQGHFEQFGDIDYVSVVKDRNTKESKGFAYVKYHRMSHAAKAYEDCDRSYKPVFADPKPSKNNNDVHHVKHAERRSGSSHDRQKGGPGSTTSGSTTASFDPFSESVHTDGESRLLVTISSLVNHDLVWRLLDLIPGLEHSDPVPGGDANQNRPNPGRTHTYNVTYSNHQSAIYARDKLNGFEYPPGHRVSVKLVSDPSDLISGHPRSVQGFLANRVSHGNRMLHADLANLTETIATATAYLQHATGYPQVVTNGAVFPHAPGHLSRMPEHSKLPLSSDVRETYDPSYCSVKLPAPKPLAPMESAVAERLFIVCAPSPPPPYALKDVFGRFGNLIDIYMINSKTYGYAKYASKESADSVVAALHGQEVCGSRLKVMLADPHDKNEGAGRKRPKID